MSRVILAEVREIVILMSMLLGLSLLTLLVAGAAVMITDSQNQRMAELVSAPPLTLAQR